MKSKIEQFINSSNKEIRNIEEQLIQLVREESKQYRDVEKSLNALKKQVRWDGNAVLISIIDNVTNSFEKEKNGLSVK
ncbi:hypothetical protein [Peribacillus aracenensis]|uniref:hypothetical protein n=1 Tax=Peribacillus aracenensis TaxID=2976708 RepID=UPI0021A4D679|nr:hypothetical protein [Peribacillus sp. BBB004]